MMAVDPAAGVAQRESPSCTADADIHAPYRVGYRRPRGAADEGRWLVDSPLLQVEHDRIRLLALRLTQLKWSTADKAVACFQHVQKIPFQYCTDPAATPSVAVQLAHAGDCYTKATLFVALLRACGIAARIRLVLLAPGYLRGIANTGGRPVLHAFTEVLAGDHWLGVDSYLADVQMSLAARIALIQEGAQLGWGLHLRGQVAWDGKTSSFGSFAPGDPASLPLADLGAYDDFGQFCQETAGYLPANWLQKRHWAFAAHMANLRIRRLRARRPADARAAGHFIT